MLAHSCDQAELTRFIQIISSKLNHSNYYQQLSQPGLKVLEAEISKFHHSYYFPNEGQLDSRRLLITLEKYLIERKVKWLKNTLVKDIIPPSQIAEKMSEKPEVTCFSVYIFSHELRISSDFFHRDWPLIKVMQGVY